MQYRKQLHKLFKGKMSLSRMKFVFTPDWFLGKDVMIEGFSFIVLFIFFFLCVKYYNLSKKKNFRYLGIGFLLIALAQLAMILTKLVLYYDTTFTQEVGQMIVTYRIVNSVDIFYRIGFFFHRFFTLLGFYLIYRLPAKKKISGDVILALFFIILSAVLSSSFYYLFHLTVLVILILIINNYYRIYKEKRLTNTYILVVAFSALAISQLLFIVSELSTFFVAANIIELAAYIMLLSVIVRILYFAKAEKSKKI